MKTFLLLCSLLTLNSCHCGCHKPQKAVVLLKVDHQESGDHTYLLKLRDIKNDSIHSEEVEMNTYLTYNPLDTILWPQP